MPLANALYVRLGKKPLVVVGDGDQVVLLEWQVMQCDARYARLGVHPDKSMVAVAVHITGFAYVFPIIVGNRLTVRIYGKHVTLNVFCHTLIVGLFDDVQYRHRKIRSEALRVAVDKAVKARLSYDEDLFHAVYSVVDGGKCSSSNESLTSTGGFPSISSIALAMITLVGYQCSLKDGGVGHGTSGAAMERGASTNPTRCWAALAIISEPTLNAPLVVSTVSRRPVFFIDA